MAFNEGHEYRERIGADAAGEPLVAYLSRRYAHSSLSEWTLRIDAGQVLIDAATAHPGTVLRPGQTLTWRRPPWDEPDAPAAFTVLFEDADLLAVDKPAGLPTLPGAGFLRQTLLARVRERDPGASPLHRLGRWTSGVVLFARTARARTELTRQWRDGSIGKRYRALASGSPERDAYTIEHPIGPVPHPLLGTVHGATAAGKPSTTHVVVLERRAGSLRGARTDGPEPWDAFRAPEEGTITHALCDVRIDTGRPHQIRIHLAAAGHPLVGDPLYVAGGVPAPGSTALPGDPGYFLHAAELTLRHPRTGEPLVVRSLPPRLLRPAQ